MNNEPKETLVIITGIILVLLTIAAVIYVEKRCTVSEFEVVTDNSRACPVVKIVPIRSVK